MFSQIFIVRKLNDPHNGKVGYIDEVLKQICGRHILILKNEQDINEETLVIAVGGDGTMLEAMRIAHKYGAIATGINLGKIGFLTDFPNDHSLISEIHDALNEANHPIEERIALQYRILDKVSTTDFNPRVAFNEFVISNKYSDNLIKYTLFIGNRRAGVHRANALIISTPTGSTAYSLSAGGGLLLPSMEAIQVVPVSPISMTSRPIIIPSHEEIRISIETDGEWVLKCDGSKVVSFDNDHYIDTQVVISQSNCKVMMLHSKHWSYFDMLTQKLGWKSN